MYRGPLKYSGLQNSLAVTNNSTNTTVAPLPPEAGARSLGTLALVFDNGASSISADGLGDLVAVGEWLRFVGTASNDAFFFVQARIDADTVQAASWIDPNLTAPVNESVAAAAAIHRRARYVQLCNDNNKESMAFWPTCDAAYSIADPLAYPSYQVFDDRPLLIDVSGYVYLAMRSRTTGQTIRVSPVELS